MQATTGAHRMRKKVIDIASAAPIASANFEPGFPEELNVT
jgi:hypothetical protein